MHVVSMLIFMGLSHVSLLGGSRLNQKRKGRVSRPEGSGAEVPKGRLLAGRRPTSNFSV